MLTIDPAKSFLLVIDFQSRLIPVIHESVTAVRNAGRLIEAAKLFHIPRLFTEQNPKGLGPTVPDLPVDEDRLIRKLGRTRKNCSTSSRLSFRRTIPLPCWSAL